MECVYTCKASGYLQAVSKVIIYIVIMNCFINLSIRLFSLFHPSSVLLCFGSEACVCVCQVYYFRQYRHTDTHGCMPRN